MGRAFILAHTYAIYASTKGISTDTQLITVSVKSDDELLAIVNDEAGSVMDGR